MKRRWERPTKKNKKEGEGDKKCHRTQAIACYYQHGHNIRSHRRRRPHNHDVSSDVALNSVGSSHIFNMDFVLRWLYIDILINLWSEFLMNESCHIFSLSLFLCVCFRNYGKSNEHSCIQLIYRYPWPKWQFSASLAAQSAVHFVSSFLRNNWLSLLNATFFLFFIIFICTLCTVHTATWTVYAHCMPSPSLSALFTLTILFYIFFSLFRVVCWLDVCCPPISNIPYIPLLLLLLILKIAVNNVFYGVNVPRFYQSIRSFKRTQCYYMARACTLQQTLRLQRGNGNVKL